MTSRRRGGGPSRPSAPGLGGAGVAIGLIRKGIEAHDCSYPPSPYIVNERSPIASPQRCGFCHHCVRYTSTSAVQGIGDPDRAARRVLWHTASDATIPPHPLIPSACGTPPHQLSSDGANPPTMK